jgi:predicted esterase
MLFTNSFGCSSGHKSGRGGIPGTSTGTGTGTDTGTGSGTGTGGDTGGSSGSDGPLGVNSIANGYSYAPDSYVDGGDPYPLIFILHGLGDNPKNLLLMWSSVAKDHGYLLCSLAASDTGSIGGYNNDPGSVDEQNMLAMLEHMKSNYNVRLDKITLFGFSNGGYYCCTLIFRFAKNPFDAWIVCSAYSLGFAQPSATKGWDITTRIHSSGHNVPQSELPAMADWLDSKIP